MTYGAAPCPHHVRTAVEGRFGLRLLQAYGMTEAPNAVTMDPLDRPVRETAVGLPLPHIRLQVVDDDGTPQPAGTPGEVRIGPDPGSVGELTYRPMRGYWRNAEATAAALRDGFFHTGDVGVVDDDGYLHIVDRKKDMIIRGGNNVFPAEIERVLLSHPAVDEAYVVGIPDERLGEVPKAFVVLVPGQQVPAGELLELVGERLAAYKRLEQVELVESDQLPRTALGKVLKRELRDRARRETGGRS
ncbi:MAG: AMP-binding protein [Acidimicrobiia bacterium]|nr:AMP-binding protein [Acidimicrobiia bacterium]